TLADFAAVARKVGAAESHALFGIRARAWSPAMDDEFERRVTEAQQAVEAVHEATRALERCLGQSMVGAPLNELDVLNTVLTAVAATDPVCQGLLRATAPEAAYGEALALVALGEQRDALRGQLEANYAEDLHRLDLDGIATRL